MMSSPYGTITHFQRWKHCEHSVVESESLSRCHPDGVQEPGITDLGITESGITESGITGGNRKRV